MNPKSLFRRIIANQDRLTPTRTLGGPKPHEAEIWRTRDGKHKVQIILHDPMRPDDQYPICGLVLEPEGGGDFKYKQTVTYPRFTSSGQFVYGREHPLDLVGRIV